MARHIDFTKHSRPVRMAAHAIGLNNKRPYMRHNKTFYRPYRNYYTTAPTCDGYEVWEGLRNNGYAIRWPSGRGGYTYNLTRKGLDWLGETLDILIYDEED